MAAGREGERRLEAGYRARRRVRFLREIQYTGVGINSVRYSLRKWRYDSAIVSWQGGLKNAGSVRPAIGMECMCGFEIVPDRAEVRRRFCASVSNAIACAGGVVVSEAGSADGCDGRGEDCSGMRTD